MDPRPRAKETAATWLQLTVPDLDQVEQLCLVHQDVFDWPTRACIDRFPPEARWYEPARYYRNG